MRSALTDAPVVSFTTLLLKATQHTTGLMVKVALLLPSRDLLSSQRQLRWTHTWSFALFGLNQYGQLHKFYLTSTYRTGQTFFKFPNKRKALDVVRQATSDRTKNKRTEKLDEYVNNKR